MLNFFTEFLLGWRPLKVLETQWYEALPQWSLPSRGREEEVAVMSAVGRAFGEEELGSAGGLGPLGRPGLGALGWHRSRCRALWRGQDCTFKK